ncbi:leucine-rich repeat flightless-interacting protein 1 isoform X20 [Bombina bombina]|uniref:leucine-rich repeat flightless-interacting protein 1 isoform X20 n=1 Tax=Bombina bombina TaxID=8345 RepID=UPI00235A52F9|nr:leucine-rich repeat flightless-interacting protein 1 isoform X20 [Bombina bombina]
MGTQGPGRKRHPNRDRRSAEDHALNQIAREAEARLAAKRAARAEAREIRMKELERQQKEIYQVQKKYYGLDTKWGDIEQWMEDSERYSNRPRRNPQASDEDEVMSVGSRSSLRTNGYEDELLGISQYKKSSRSSTGSGETSRGPPRDEVLNTYYSDTGSTLNSKSQQPLHNGSRPSLLTCSTLPSRSQRQSSLYDEGVTSGSRRYSSSSSRPPSEYSCYLGSGSRASSRASSARASPVSFEPPSLPVYRCGSTSGISLGCLEDITISSSSGIEERPDKDFTEKGSRSASSLSAATLASLGGSSSRRGSGDTSISVDTEASIREIKEISELKEQIQDVEGKYMQGLKEMKDSLAEVEEKYKRSMVTNAQLDNEKTSLQYQVDNFHEVLLELEEELAESRRQYDEKHKECERQKHEHTVLRFQLAEMKESLEQREQMLAEIRQLQQKLDSSVCEICDLKETIEWKEKKIGALERQKDFFDPVRKERDDLREEVTHLRGQLKKHGIALDSDVTPNGDAASESHGENVYPADEPIMETPLDTRLKKLLDERESFLDQIKRLKGQLEERNQRTNSPENYKSEDLENGTDQQRDANRQISDLKFKLTKSTQEITALEQNIIRLESQVTRYKTSAESAEKIEDELKAEKRKLQRELRTALDKIDELEVGNSHLMKRLEKMKANRSAMLSQQ